MAPVESLRFGPFQVEVEGQKTTPLTLSEVIASVQTAYPLLAQAFLDRAIADGELTAAFGPFDLNLKASSTSDPLGYYKTYRQTIGLEQQLLNDGVKVFTGYRIGRGLYPTYYQDRETNDGGEFRAGVALPLLRGRAIDSTRAALLKANLGREIVEPIIRAQRIEYFRAASKIYWKWVAAGQKRRVVEQVLRIALERNQSLDAQVRAGQIAPFELLDNRRLVLQRQNALIKAERDLQQAAVELSLYYRDASGTPVTPLESQLPSFPDPDPPNTAALNGDLELAQSQRPELQRLRLTRNRACVDLRLAQNQTLPTLDATIAGSQDVGFPASSKNDKSDFEFQAALVFELPVQRRFAQGKVHAARGLLSQIAVQEQFTREKIAAEVRDALSALQAAFLQRRQAHETAELAKRLQQLERANFDTGNSTILVLNLREQQTFESLQSEVDALAEYHRAAADYRAALATDASEPPG